MIDDTARRREPIFNFGNLPIVVWVTALGLILLYAAYSFASFSEQQGLLYDFALAPERFWAPAGSPKVYPDAASGLLTLVSTALLHGSWLHVIVNSLMILQFGVAVARVLGPGLAGAAAWMLLFVVSIAAGSAVYLALLDVTGYPAVGASGGTSGLIAAAFLIDPATGRKRALWSREFLVLSAVFVAINVVMVLTEPYLGMMIAWQAHAGGYVAGALLMAVLPFRGVRAAQR